MKHFFFLHIPKAGGTTLRQVLQRQFRKQQVYLIEDDINGDIARYSALSPEQASAYGLVMGHMRFGLHQALKTDDYAYLSLLREPVARVMSEYQFIKNNPHHSLYSAVSQMRLEDYLDSGVSDQISNGQVRLLSGSERVLPDGSTEHRAMTEQDLHTALNNVKQHFKHIGFIERYDASLLRWKRAFGWRLPLYVKANITHKAVMRSPISDEQRNKIKQLNTLDIKLYQILLSEFDQSIQQAGLGFKVSLLSYKGQNRLYQKYVQLRY